MRIDKVYTRAGDTGSTRLVGGQEVSKADARVEAYGSVDELGAVLGLARTFTQEASAANPQLGQVAAQLRRVQNDLFSLAAVLATLPDDRWDGMSSLGPTHVAALEASIDRYNLQLEPLEEFILAGGGLIGAHLHLARTVCRRAERRVVGLALPDDEVTAHSRQYLNRLSDLLFVLARWVARVCAEPELSWER